MFCWWWLLNLAKNSPSILLPSKEGLSFQPQGFSCSCLKARVTRYTTIQSEDKQEI